MFSIFIIFGFSCIFAVKDLEAANDPHESISRRTPLGTPYYFENESNFPQLLFTTTGLIVFEYLLGNVTDALLLDLQELNSRNQELPYGNDVDIISNDVLESATLGSIFQGFYINEEKRHEFYRKIHSSKGYSDKLFVSKGAHNMTLENNLFQASLMNCKANLIPDSLITPKVFNSVLEEFFEETLLPKMLDLAIPTHLLSLYYKASLASCVLTDNTILVAIQIPVRPTTSEKPSIDSFRLTPIPLWKPTDQNTVCHLMDGAQPNYPEGIYFILNNSTEVVYEKDVKCDLAGTHLCYLPDQRNIIKRSVRRGCVQAILEMEDEDMACPLKCEPSGTFTFPIIRKVASDRYLLVSDLKFSEAEVAIEILRVECPPFLKEEVLEFPPTGALEIILPCDCHIRYKEDIFKASSPCGAEFSKIPIDFPGNFD